MENHSTPAALDRGAPASRGRWESLVSRRSSAFVVAGSLVLASLLAPIGMSPVTDRPWLAGLGLVGLAVVSVAVGHLGVYPALRDRAPRLALAGAVSATVAGAAGAVLVGLTGAALVSGLAVGVALTVPKVVFMAIAVVMAMGYGVGFLTFGLAGRHASALSGPISTLLVAGGVALLVPVAGELLRLGIGTGTPPWLVVPVLAFVAVDTIGVGLGLRRADRKRGATR